MRRHLQQTRRLLRHCDVCPNLGQGLGGDASRPFLLLAYGAANWPMVREAQRHLAQWALMPIAAMIGQEASEKLGQPVTLDVMRPLQALDAGGRARELGAIVHAMALAKEAGVDPSEALKLVDWEG